MNPTLTPQELTARRSGVLVVFPTGSLTSKDRERLAKNGYCAIEASDPSKVVIVIPGSAIHVDDFSMAAIEALSGTYKQEERSTFAKALFERIKNRNQQPPGE